MLVKCIGSLGSRTELVKEAKIVIIEDSYGNPLFVAVETQPGVHTFVTVEDPDFNRVIRGLGIDKLVVNEMIRTDKSVDRNAKLILGPGRTYEQ